jgi:hypothetical protein
VSIWRKVTRAILVVATAALAVLIVVAFIPNRLLFGTPNQLRVTDRLTRGIAVSGTEFARGEFDRLCLEPVVYDRSILKNLKNDWTFESMYGGERSDDVYYVIFFAGQNDTKYSLIRNVTFQASDMNGIFRSTECVALSRITMNLQLANGISAEDVEEASLLISIDKK